MSFEIDDFKIYPFDKNKYYIVLLDPGKVSFRDLINAEWMNTPGPEVIFIPCKDPHKASMQLTYDSIQDLEDFVKGLKNKQND